MPRSAAHVLCWSLAYGCGSVISQTGVHTNQAANTPIVTVRLPEANYLYNYLDNPEEARINAYYLRLWTTDPTCAKDRDLSRLGAFTGQKEMSFSVNLNCTYRASLQLGFVSNIVLEGGRTTYASTIRNLLVKNCLSCHSAGGQEAKTDLSRQETVLALKEKIQARVANQSMPPNKTLPSTKLREFAAWNEEKAGAADSSTASGLEEVILTSSSDLIFKATPVVGASELRFQFNQ